MEQNPRKSKGPIPASYLKKIQEELRLFFLHSLVTFRNLPFFLRSTQIFAYNQTEVPQVRDLGFAVGPGQHALVGVTVSQVFIKFIINVEIISKRSDWIKNL